MRRTAFGPITTILATMITFMQPLAASAKPFDCGSERCGIAIDAPYPNLAVGQIDGISTPEQTAAIFRQAYKFGLWRVFPQDISVFVANIQPISIRITSGQSITVLAATSETRVSGLEIGQLVRFAPHRGLHMKPRPNDPYWVGVGCVELLCIPGDGACQSGYRPGLYKLSTGAELDPSGKNVVSGGIVVDVYSMRPKSGLGG